MKKLELYQCEVCNTQYSDKKKAMDCEKSHKMPTSCVGKKYRAVSSNPDGYPDKVMVTFNDGSTAEYEFKGKQR